MYLNKWIRISNYHIFPKGYFHHDWPYQQRPVAAIMRLRSARRIVVRRENEWVLMYHFNPIIIWQLWRVRTTRWEYDPSWSSSVENIISQNKRTGSKLFRGIRCNRVLHMHLAATQPDNCIFRCIFRVCLVRLVCWCTWSPWRRKHFYSWILIIITHRIAKTQAKWNPN